jgi:hypothetical protein
MGDLIRDTPPDLISRVFLEDKVFKTWYHGRTILIGDGKKTLMMDDGDTTMIKAF